MSLSHFEPAPTPGSGADHGAAVRHFPGLNGLRFVAAFAVILNHLEWFKLQFGLDHWLGLPGWQGFGTYGVVCFFVLSGFLITYLLLVEGGRTGTIRVGRFYMRRLLRIWPLYYLIVALGFPLAVAQYRLVEAPAAVTGPLTLQLILYLTFLPNVAQAFNGTISFVGPLWSLGVEEQFYLLWPVLLKFARQPLRWLLGTVAVVVAARVALAGILPPPAAPGEPLAMLAMVIATFKIECMAIGGLGAWLVHERQQRLLGWLYLPASQLAAGIGVVGCVLLGLHFGPLDNVVYGGLFTVVVVNLATNPRTLIRLERPWLDRLGRISYGLYVYHSFVIVGLLVVLQGRLAPLALNAVLYPATLALTIVIAALSYRYVEQPFLRRKDRYSVIGSDRRAS